MKYLSTEEYILQVSDSLKTQNRRINKRFVQEKEDKKNAEERIGSVINKFEQIKKYAKNELLFSLAQIKGNDRYVFQYMEDSYQYFKLIIKNKVTGMENFMIISYNMREFFVKKRVINSDSNTEVINENYFVEKFSRGKFRKVFFEYLLEILAVETLPKLKVNESATVKNIKELEAELKQKIFSNEVERLKYGFNDSKLEN